MRDYNYHSQPLWLPPCVSQDRYYPRSVPADANVSSALSQVSGLPIREVERREIITEIRPHRSTKAKDILLKATAKVLKNHPDIFLALTIEENEDPVGTSCVRLYLTHWVSGVMWQYLVLSGICCLISMQYPTSTAHHPSWKVLVCQHRKLLRPGFLWFPAGLVPFATQFLFGDQEHKPSTGGLRSLDVGQGATIVEPDNVEGFSEALDLLLTDERLHASMGRRAIEITIPRFTGPE